MTRHEAIRNITDYLKSHNIPHKLHIDEQTVQITMVFKAENAPGRYVESCIWFYEDDMEARTYYSSLGAEICQKSKNINGLFRLLNFINARVFLSCSDGIGGNLYKPHILYTPRIYLTEDGYYDISITTIINYDFLEVAPIETTDYLMAFCPELLDKLSIFIYGVLLGNITADGAIAGIRKVILEEKPGEETGDGTVIAFS